MRMLPASPIAVSEKTPVDSYIGFLIEIRPGFYRTAITPSNPQAAIEN